MYLDCEPDPHLAETLDRGEREAIELAEKVRADILIMDERKGRSLAQRRHIPVTGAIGLLGRAYQLCFLDDPMAVLAQMRRQGFRVSDRVVSTFATQISSRFAR